MGLLTISTAPDGKALAAVSPVAHARSSFPGSPGVASLGLAGDSEDPAFPQGRPRPDAKSFALNSAVHWPAKSTGDWSTGIFDPLIG